MSTFTAETTALLLIDHQIGTMQLVKTLPPEVLRRNTLALAKTAKILGLPVVLTSSQEDRAQGPLMAELAELLPEAFEARVRRAGIVNAWNDEAFRAAVEATGRRNLAMAGVTTDVCLVYPAIDAVAEGFGVQAVLDASGSPFELSEETSRRRMERAGVVLTATNTLLAELAQDWSRPEGEALLGVLFGELLPPDRARRLNARGSARITPRSTPNRSPYPRKTSSCATSFPLSSSCWASRSFRRPPTRSNSPRWTCATSATGRTASATASTTCSPSSTTRGVILVDAPPTLADRLPAALDALSDKPVTHLVYTHSHTDHIGGAGALLAAGGRAEGAEVVAQAETAATLAERNDPRRPVPTRTLTDTLTLDAGGQTLRLDYLGPNHEAGNLFVHLPRQRVLMLVDVVYPGWVPFKNLGIAADVAGYVEAHRQALGYDFETLVAGHVDRPGTRADVEQSLAFVTDLEAAARAALAAVAFQDVMGEAMAREGFEPNAWSLFDAYQDAVVADCRTRLDGEWRDQLKGYATYIDDACWKMIETVQVDLGPAGAARPATRPAGGGGDVEAAAAGFIDPDFDGLTVVNVLTPAPADQERVIDLLRRGIDGVIRRQPGFVAAAIHRSTDSGHVVVYARWRSAADLQGAGKTVGAGGAPDMAEAYRLGKAEYHAYEVMSVISADPQK